MDHIQCLFTLENFVGIIGGRPKYAAYLVGSFDKVAKFIFYFVFKIN
jgi:hypothetical protein